MRNKLKFYFAVSIILYSINAFCQPHIQVALCKKNSWSLGIGTIITYSREITSFDSLGNILYFETDGSGYPGDTTWTYGSRNTYTYDTLSRRMSNTSERFQSNMWIKTYRQLYFYGNNSGPSSVISQVYDSSSWLNLELVNYTYNLNNDTISEEIENWNQGWTKHVMYSTSYDTAHHVLERIYLTWDSITYDTTNVTEYHYQFNGSQISSVVKVYQSDSILYSYLYDIAGRDSAFLIIRCYLSVCGDTVSGVFNSYNPPFDTSTTYYDIFTTGTWTQNDFYNRTYNSSGLLTSVSGMHYYYNYLYDTLNNLSKRKDCGFALDANGCRDCFYSIFYSDSLVVQATSSDTICPGDSSMLILSIIGGVPPYAITWLDNGGHNGPLRTVNPHSTTTYYYTVTDSTGTTISDSITIVKINYPADSVIISGVSPFCPGDSITLSYYFPSPVNNHYWNQNGFHGSDSLFIIKDTGQVFLFVGFDTLNCPLTFLSSKVNIPLTICTNVKETNKTPFNVSPNPCQTKTVVTCEGASNILFSIYDLQGNLLFQNKIANGATIDVSLLKSGIYFLKCLSEHAIFVTTLIKE